METLIRADDSDFAPLPIICSGFFVGITTHLSAFPLMPIYILLTDSTIPRSDEPQVAAFRLLFDEPHLRTCFISLRVTQHGLQLSSAYGGDSSHRVIFALDYFKHQRNHC